MFCYRFNCRKVNVLITVTCLAKSQLYTYYLNTVFYFRLINGNQHIFPLTYFFLVFMSSRHADKQNTTFENLIFRGC